MSTAEDKMSRAWLIIIIGGLVVAIAGVGFVASIFWRIAGYLGLL